MLSMEEFSMTQFTVLNRAASGRDWLTLLVAVPLVLAGCGGGGGVGSGRTSPPAASTPPMTTAPSTPTTPSTPTVQVPAVPAGLKATPGNATVMLTWTASSGA